MQKYSDDDLIDLLNEEPVEGMIQEKDPCCLATIRHFRSLVPIGQEKRKPIFNLTPADGAIGSHFISVTEAKSDFEQLAQKIAGKMGIQI